MNIHVLGRSRSGKTPVALAISEALGAHYIAVGDWVRSISCIQATSMEEYIKKATEIATHTLRQNRKACVDFIMRNHSEKSITVIDGIRSPHEFVHLFETTVDIVVRLDCRNNPLEETSFEKGLGVIDSYIDWLQENNMVERKRFLKYSFDCLYISETRSEDANVLEACIPSIIQEVMDIISAR
jgi:adenylate kinase family enzyme